MRIDDPGFSVWLDDRFIIQVRTRTAWTIEIADRYWACFQPFLDASRAQWGHARVLVDRRGTPIMPITMVQVMRDGIMAFYRPGDRLALVVDSSPLKMQVRQNYQLPNIDAFLSYDAALAWLENS
ncbi:hypothetical protein QE363_000119 [Sphingomonas sp. SORGH_AS870]|uniref:hypothetical protein n=1 Tax=Sphingomonas sp. SORGH_AS_0870 TaxID=3041801 RepID=UPI002856A509|nr:hypothetical protein [Sphingomonas sp. SORGH_AS_0870]MDR6144326.1 hypothetical protein [Sphingomonas sp. SORGH_AS_0870]